MKHWHKCRSCGEYFECDCGHPARLTAYCEPCKGMRWEQTVVVAALRELLHVPVIEA